MSGSSWASLANESSVVLPRPPLLLLGWLRSGQLWDHVAGMRALHTVPCTSSFHTEVPASMPRAVTDAVPPPPTSPRPNTMCYVYYLFYGPRRRPMLYLRTSVSVGPCQTTHARTEGPCTHIRTYVCTYLCAVQRVLMSEPPGSKQVEWDGFFDA